MRPLLLLCFLALCCACKKDAVPFTSVFGLKGMWVEKSLRLDTVDLKNIPSGTDFNGRPYLRLGSAAYNDPTASLFYRQHHSNFFSYYLEEDAINLLSGFSSSLIYTKFEFAWGPDRKSFTIKRFYNRKELPDTIVFERIK
jgi:hypothetical protein